jgi:hypothetical protein
VRALENLCVNFLLYFTCYIFTYDVLYLLQVHEMEKLFVTYSVLDKRVHGLGSRSSTMDYAELKVGFRVYGLGLGIRSSLPWTALSSS